MAPLLRGKTLAKLGVHSLFRAQRFKGLAKILVTLSEFTTEVFHQSSSCLGVLGVIYCALRCCGAIGVCRFDFLVVEVQPDDGANVRKSTDRAFWLKLKGVGETVRIENMACGKASIAPIYIKRGNIANRNAESQH